MNHRNASRQTERRCFRKLLKLVHAEALQCPDCGARDGLHIHEVHPHFWHVRYRCAHCGHTFNPWTGTPLKSTHRPPSEILRIIKGIIKGESDSQLARELGRDRGSLAIFRHKLERWMNRLPKETFTNFPTTSKK